MRLKRTACISVGIVSWFVLSTAQAEIDFGQDVDTSLPVEILSDTLTVKTQENVAIFMGNVQATQGVVKLTANQMDVYYSTKDDKNTAAAPNREGDGLGEAINKIRVGGNVKLTTPGKEATSNLGTYDVAKGFVVLQGNVVLNHEGQVLTGEKFIHNIKEGTSRMLSQADVSHNRQVKTGKAKSRVKGLFIPKNRQK